MSNRRATIHPIIGRLSVDTLIGQMARFREDERFKAVGPDSIVLSFPASGLASALPPSGKQGGAEEAEIWFDWAFADFWKSNYCMLSYVLDLFCGLLFFELRRRRPLICVFVDTVQRGFSTEPDQLSSTNGQSAESAMLIASLRDVIRKQSGEIEALQKRLKETNSSVPKV